MAKFKGTEVLSRMESTGMVPVFYHPDLQVAKEVVRACYKGGVRVFEFTNRGDFAHEVFSGLCKFVREACPEMVLGAGSVVDPATAAIYIQAGADFIVGPLLNPDVARICNRRLIPYIPGCATPTEIGQAHELGCQFVKIFPADAVGGPAFVKSVKAPMPWCNIMVTGGVEPSNENLTEWFQAGVDCVGMGSNLFPKEEVNAGEWDKICIRCEAVISTIKKLKS